MAPRDQMTMHDNTTPSVLPMVTSQELRSGLAPAAFNAVALRDQLAHIKRASFASGPLTLDDVIPLGDVELAERFPGGGAALLRIEPRMIVVISIARGNAEIAVAGGDRDDVDRVTTDFVSTLRDDERDEGSVPVTFWAYSPGLPLKPRRRVEAPAWAAIRDNYAAATRTALDELMRATTPGPGGLVLWHGEPGTGKSYALRALARAWRPWCDTHLITDPEAFLGSKTDYLMATLLRTERGSDDEARWRLVVLEDAGELLAADARAVSGPALSRLLNVTDGLLGAGLRAVILVTTNEPVGRLHEAVSRPGRCWVQVEFTGLSAADSNGWLASRGLDAEPLTRGATLAELYAIGGGRRVTERERPQIGFAS